MIVDRLRSRRGTVAIATAFVLGSVAAICSPLISAGAATVASADASHAVSASLTKVVTRTNLVNGQSVTVDKRTVHLHVNLTTDLRDRQELQVNWSGAHPTGGAIGDENSGTATQEEYPFVLLECRGVDSGHVPASQRLSPKTCWTQTPTERYQADYDQAYPPWRLDQYGSIAQRGPDYGGPAKVAAACPTGALAEHWVPFAAQSGTTYFGGANGCAGLAPEATNLDGSSLPSNETYGVTGPDGTGSAKFDIWSQLTNASLGCTEKVRCSLVAVPIMGISCDPTAADMPPADRPTPAQAAVATPECEATGHYAPGSVGDGRGGEDYSVSGALWWSASNWRNRMTVPLSFAPLSNTCGVTNTTEPVDVYGSELMTQATTQWSPTFCLNKNLFNFKHVQTPEPQAASLLETGNIEAAFLSDPPATGYAVPTVNAPVAVSGFAIGADIDNNKGQPVATVRLDARLLAKLLTESYPAIPAIQDHDKALSHNPLDITQDPEFIALNPGLGTTGGRGVSAATLLALSSDSDVMTALTSYINADPDARAWLNGKPDPWGMTVNPAYKGIALPVDNWPLLDTYEPKSIYKAGINDCLQTNPVPYLPLVAAPTQRLSTISLDMQFALSNSLVGCNVVNVGSSLGLSLSTLGRQQPGDRFMFGVMSLADAARYDVDTAKLETQTSPTAAATFTNTDGRTFVGPSNASLKAAMALAKPDKASGSWPISSNTLRTDPSGADAYPGTMVVYGAVPTKGLPIHDAQDYSKLLRFAAGRGQTPGLANGQLPPGYLPLTEANGLGSLAAYTERAATAVAAQKGQLPSLTGGSPSKGGGSTSPTPTTSPTQTHSSGPSGPHGAHTNRPTGGGGNQTEPASGTSPGQSSPSNQSSSQPTHGTGTVKSPPASSSPSASSTAKTPAVADSSSPPIAVVLTAADGSGVGGLALPVLVAFVVFAGSAALIFAGLGRRTHGRL